MFFTQRQLKIKNGFSLIEVLLMMLILSAVVLPLMMVLSIEKQNLMSDQINSANQIIVGQLLDNINAHHPDAINAYTVSTLTSTSCDPAEKTLTMTQSTYSATQLVNKACNTALGPFFTRTVSFTTDNAGNKTYQGLLVLLSLYKKSTDTTPYYSTSRLYDLNDFQINVGVALPYNATASKTIPYFDKLTKMSLTPNYLLSAANLHSDGSNIYWSQDVSTQDFTIGDHALDTVMPNAAGLYLQGGPVIYYFKLMGNTNYLINIQFLYSHKQISPYTAADNINGQVYTDLPINTNSASTNCLPNTTKVSCELINIDASTIDTTGTVTDLATFNNFDISAPLQDTFNNNNNNLLVPFSFPITTPAPTTVGDAVVLRLTLAPPGYSGTYAIINNIEVKRMP